jgi:hypothetical protein
MGSGVESMIPYLNGWGILEAIGTFGLLPSHSGFSMGVRIGLFAGALGVAMIAWHLSKSWIKTICSAFWFSLIGICSMSGVSLAIFWNAPWIKATWMALPVEMTRRASSVLGKGYWWESIYDRFPTAIDGQIDIGLRLFSAVGALTVVVLLLVVLFLKEKPQRSLIRYVYGSWGAVLFVSAITIGFILGYLDASIARNTTFIPAFILIAYLIVALRLSSVLHRDIVNLEQDERAGIHQPIVDGKISLDHAKTISGIADVSAVVVSCALGWQILLLSLAYLACAKLTRDRLWVFFPQLSIVFRMIGSVALAGIGYLFLTQDIHLTSRLFMAMGIAFAVRLLIEGFWLPKWKNIGRE